MTEADRYKLHTAAAYELSHAIAIDDAASLLFKRAGCIVELSERHPFVVAERMRWRSAMAAGELWFACNADEPIGFSALGRVEGLSYLEQLAVVPEHGRRGVGALLLEKACSHSRARGDREIWLTTYAHLPWNAPFYARHGFARVSDTELDEGLRVVLSDQRGVLPEPAQRIAMRRRLG